jgi:glucose/arabinose dehydrogenase
VDRTFERSASPGLVGWRAVRASAALALCIAGCGTPPAIVHPDDAAAHDAHDGGHDARRDGATDTREGTTDAHGDTTEPPPGPSFHKVTLDPHPGESIGLAVLPDGRLLHTTRPGTVWIHQSDGTKSVAAQLPVYTHDDEGLLGIAIDPDFDTNRWVYVYYSPPLDTPTDDPATAGVDEGAAPMDGLPEDFAPFRGAIRLSRFQLVGDQLDLASEQTILEVPVDRGICCHTAGKIDFDAAGNLYLSTGDDSYPFASDGFAPIDQRPGANPALDAQRSASNTNDLRGKLLRIHVAADGTYAVPDGNLFAPGLPGTRPEIYAMGLRNPYRYAVNRATGAIYLADFSPDAEVSDPARGPVGTGKWLIVRGAANYGWPYCVGHLAYVAYDFETGLSGAPFDCDHPRNQSPRNTGLVDLPPVVDPEVAYSYARSAEFPELGTGGVGPMAGPAYVFAPGSPPARRWPEAYAGAPLFYEFTRGFIAAFHLDAAGRLASIERLPGAVSVSGPIDMAFGPDGALYVLEYGSGYYVENPDAQLSRIEYRLPAPGE